MPKRKEEKNTQTGSKLSRRDLIGSVTAEMIAFVEEFHGRPQVRLSEMKELSDKDIGEIIPQINPDVEISVEADKVIARFKNRKDKIELFNITKENTAVFNRINNKNKLSQIAEDIANELEWDENKSFKFAREFFEKLAATLVCIPSNFVE